MAVKRTTPSVGRILALLAGAAGVGFGSAAVAQRHEREVLDRSVRVRVDQRVAPPAATRRAPSPKPHRVHLATHAPNSHNATAAAKPHRRPAASSTAQLPVATTAPALQTPPQAPAPVTPVTPVTPPPATIVSGGS